MSVEALRLPWAPFDTGPASVSKDDTLPEPVPAVRARTLSPPGTDTHEPVLFDLSDQYESLQSPDSALESDGVVCVEVDLPSADPTIAETGDDVDTPR